MIGFGTAASSPSPIRALPFYYHLRLYLNIFRREPAITKFVWPFTPIHSSSQPFQWVRVQSSTRYYTRFNLAMDRSLSFGSAASDLIALLRLAFATASHSLNLARYHNSQDHYAKGWFQVLFHSAHCGSTFPSRYLFAIAQRVVFRVGEWSPRLQPGFLVSWPTLDTAT
ncbi:hypothetical protein HPHPH21_1619 [Helicobacter pylori Hp H-21]|nr:hypothetical protein HPHPH21_1619 [Helicobacter pylori Hp H-21]